MKYFPVWIVDFYVVITDYAIIDGSRKMEIFVAGVLNRVWMCLWESCSWCQDT